MVVRVVYLLIVLLLLLVLMQLSGRLTIQAFKDRVMKVVRVWDDWAVYPPLFTKGLEATFLKDEKLLQSVFARK